MSSVDGHFDQLIRPAQQLRVVHEEQPATEDPTGRTRSRHTLLYGGVLPHSRCVRYRRSPTFDPLERLERVQRVSDTALSHLSVDDLLNELLLRVREILDADTAAVLLLDESRNELVARAAKGIEEEVERGVRIPMGKGFAGRIAAERVPVALYRVDHSTVLNPILFQKGIRSLLGVPLLANNEVVGVMHVGTTTPHTFSQDEIDLMQLVADRVALALQVRLSDRGRVVLDAFQRTF
ncbi:MAG TPA: GAF domain-containing protein, partial [Actinomycetota bacterium]|nr:GAF domain-containing protein [Actinomycetota bacterium]